MGLAFQRLAAACSSISYACSGEYKSAGGFVWRYENDAPDTIDEVKPRITKIRQLTKDGKFIKEWDSATEACKELGIKSSSHVYAVCKGNRSTTGGYKWEYVDE